LAARDILSGIFTPALRTCAATRRSKPPLQKKTSDTATFAPSSPPPGPMSFPRSLAATILMSCRDDDSPDGLHELAYVPRGLMDFMTRT
jgi:hypothetical protein